MTGIVGGFVSRRERFWRRNVAEYAGFFTAK
jgi:hypothetical protein